MSALLEGTRGLLFDVEGTLTPIAFVKDVLFPLARRRIPDFLASGESSAMAALSALRAEYEGDGSVGRPTTFGDGLAYVCFLMDEDRKSTALKDLQGLVWRLDYESGRLAAPVFPDVAPAFARFQRSGRSVRIYSSGSVLAQRLLLAHTTDGDLTQWIDGYHDTTTGAKRERASYLAIAASFGLEPATITFFSDIQEELDAARTAGLSTRLVVRPGNGPSPRPSHQVLTTFDGLL